MTEEDTFNKLRRRPIADVINDWYIRSMGGKGLRDYIEYEKYTPEEFLSAWYDIYLHTNPPATKARWIAENLNEINNVY